MALCLAAVLVSTAGTGDIAMGGADDGSGGGANATTVDLRVITRPDGGEVPPLLPARTRTTVSFDGLGQDDAAPARPSDVTAAVGTADVLEVVNRRLAVYTKAGGRRCAAALGDLFGASAELVSPRVQYDARYGRYSLVATGEEADGGAATLYLATTGSADPCGVWWRYRLGFAGPLFPPGSRLARINLGQDPRSLLMSADNAVSGSYVGSVAFALAKSAAYAGAPVAYQAFGVAFGTAPVTSDQAGGADTDASYYLAAVPGAGYLIYRMTDSAGIDPVLVLDASIPAPFAAPARRVRQCGPGTLDPLDGRIAAAAVRAGDFIWFTHGVDAGGRPGVRYGAISLLSYTPYVALAARSRTSDDFNPSIAVADAGYGFVYTWLNWAFTDVTAQPCADASAIVDGVAPGAGVPDLVGRGTVFAPGAGSGTDAPFGEYSSAVVDPVPDAACPGGRTAVVAQQYFGASGRWRTRLARVLSC